MLKKRKTQQKLNKIVSDIPYDPISEAYQILSANIQLMLEGSSQKTILVTSVQAGEGKSVTASNIACAYALMGKRVLLIDADIRKPSLHNKLEIENKMGLSDYLKGDTNIMGITKPFKAVNGLYVITAGRIEQDPVSLLSHDRMKYLINQGSRIFDYIILDAPPAVGFADTMILSSMVNSTLIVAKEKLLDKRKISFVLKKLERISNNVIGFLLVDVKEAEAKDKYYFDYRNKQSLLLLGK